MNLWSGLSPHYSAVSLAGCWLARGRTGSMRWHSVGSVCSCAAWVRLCWGCLLLWPVGDCEHQYQCEGEMIGSCNYFLCETIYWEFDAHRIVRNPNSITIDCPHCIELAGSDVCYRKHTKSVQRGIWRLLSETHKVSATWQQDVTAVPSVQLWNGEIHASTHAYPHWGETVSVSLLSFQHQFRYVDFWSHIQKTS